VKKAIFAAVAAWTLVSLIGCNHRSNVDSLQPVQAELKPMQQSWRGILPCADCEGIETSLFLEKDGSWVMNLHYLGTADKNASFATYGTWARTADKLVLTDAQGEKSYYHVKGNALEMLDSEGQPVASQFNRTLTPVTASLPVTPMAMRGMYSAGQFTDCSTGQRLAVVSNAQLEHDYSAMGVTGNRPLLLTMDAHYTMQVKSGSKIKAIAADKAIAFSTNEKCGD